MFSFAKSFMPRKPYNPTGPEIKNGPPAGGVQACSACLAHYGNPYPAFTIWASGTASIFFASE